ncbi:MAG: PorV/PorQ family protein, partial [Candidatus Latescibacteria bacterium]|nr:PorV/PorQ family protein [Candidatus Latescibacterota bacterium]
MTRHVILVMAALYVFSAATVFSQTKISETGKTGMSFLAISPSSHITSLGSSATALNTGASSIWSNPSLIAFQHERSAQFTHTEWIEGINQEYAAISSPFSFGSMGLAVQLFDSGDIELRGNVPNSDPLGTYSIKNVSLGLTYARAITENIAAGLTYKKLFEKISDETAGGYAFDAGLLYNTPFKGISLAASARNYGRMNKLKNDRTELPSDISFGGIYNGILPGFGQSYSVLTDIVIPKYGDTGIRVGFEINPLEYMSLMLGYRSDSDIEDVSLGIGFSVDKYAA